MAKENNIWLGTRWAYYYKTSQSKTLSFPPPMNLRALNHTDECVNLLQEYEVRKKAIQIRLAEFKQVPPSEYFYELVYCLLTPQSSAKNASQVGEKLRKAQFQESPVDPEPYLRNKDHYIRFHHTKSRHLIHLKLQAPEILKMLQEPHSASELREWLRKNILGLGMKEATHFLRNIGKNDNLTILDRHILRRLQKLKVIRHIPPTLTPKMYLALERRFLEFSKQIQIPVNELDLLFWSMATGEIRK